MRNETKDSTPLTKRGARKAAKKEAKRREDQATLARSAIEAKLLRDEFEQQVINLAELLQEIPVAMARLEDTKDTSFKTFPTRVSSLDLPTKTVDEAKHWYIGSPSILSQPPRAFHAAFLGELNFWLREDGRIVTSPMVGDATKHELKAPTREYDLIKMRPRELKDITARLCGLGM
jgi:hypothetical protein